MLARERVKRFWLVGALTAAGLLVAGALTLPAIIDYTTGTDVCLSKLSIINDTDRIEAVLRWAKGDRFRTWLTLRAGADRASEVAALNSSTCCSVQHLGWADEDRITLRSMMLGGASHVVRLNALGPIDGSSAIGISVNLCGAVVETGA